MTTLTENVWTCLYTPSFGTTLRYSLSRLTLRTNARNTLLNYILSYELDVTNPEMATDSSIKTNYLTSIHSRANIPVTRSFMSSPTPTGHMPPPPPLVRAFGVMMMIIGGFGAMYEKTRLQTLINESVSNLLVEVVSLVVFLAYMAFIGIGSSLVWPLAQADHAPSQPVGVRTATIPMDKGIGAIGGSLIKHQ